MKYTLKDLLDVPKLRVLLDLLEDLHRMPAAVIDAEGTILSASGWQDICTKFHRINPDTEKMCIESDRHIEAGLGEENTSVIYRCPMGLVDSAMPIVVEGKHLGNVFTGQLFIEPPDESVFIGQARKYGFDETEYLEAMRRVPLFPEPQLRKKLIFIHSLTQMLAEQGLQNKRQLEAEANLRDAEWKFKALFDNGPIGVAYHRMIYDESGKPVDYQFIDANEKYLELTGVDPRGKTVTQAFPGIKDDPFDWIGTFGRVARTGETVHFEQFLQFNNRWYDCVGYQYRPDHFVAAFFEISERKIAEEALLKSDERHRTILRTAMDGIWLADIRGYLLEVNEAYSRMSGYSVQELLSMNISELDINETAKDTEARIQGIKARGEVRFESRHRRKDGSVFDVEVSVQYRPEEGGQCLAFLRDISERKQAEEALLRSAQNLRAVIDVSPVPFAMNDSQGNVTYLNRAFEQSIGYTLDDIPTLENWWPLAYPDPHYRDLIMSLWQRNVEEAVRTGAPFVPMEINVACKDGLLRTFICSMAPMEGNYSGSSIIVFHDITELKNMEEERLSFEQKLQQTQKLESLGVLAGGIAHDFNNILAIIIGHCSLAKLRPEAADDHIPPIEQAADRAAELCRQMLAYAGKAPFTRSEVNMTALVDEMVRMLKATTSRNVEIMPILSADIPPVTGDASQLRQIVMNLIINAAEAIGEAQGEIKVSLTKTAIRERQSSRDHLDKIIPAGWYACLEISDNGCGMDDETKRRIFEPFYTTKFTGRGLGMSAVLGIISAHKGALQLESHLGQGTTFKIYLPVQKYESAAVESQQQALSVEWQGKGTILLVEDEKPVISIAKAMVEILGFTVIEASNGKEALELYRKNAAEIDLVVTDIGMPVMDGYTLFRELKSINPELPIIVSSGFGDSVVTSRIANEDIAGLVSKPYSFDQLREVIKSVTKGIAKAPAC